MLFDIILLLVLLYIFIVFLVEATNGSAGLERVHGFTFGDSLDDSRKSKWQDFRMRLIKVCLTIAFYNSPYMGRAYEIF